MEHYYEVGIAALTCSPGEVFEFWTQKRINMAPPVQLGIRLQLL